MTTATLEHATMAPIAIVQLLPQLPDYQSCAICMVLGLGLGSEMNSAYWHTYIVRHSHGTRSTIMVLTRSHVLA